MFDHDAVVFNLQIENQHLREELHLYRQGQTTADLMDVLKDRDNELKSLRCAEKETKQKMVLLAKSSQELLKKLDILQSEKTEWKQGQHLLELSTKELRQKDEIISTLQKEQKEMSYKCEELTRCNHTLRNKINDMSSKANATTKKENDKKVDEMLLIQIATLKEENESLNNTVDLLIPESEQFQTLIGELEEDASMRDVSIDKLHERCSALVKESMSKSRSLTKQNKELSKEVCKKEKEIEKYRQEVLKAQSFNTNLKEKLKQRSASSTSSLEREKAEYLERIAHLEKQLRNMVNVSTPSKSKGSKKEIKTKKGGQGMRTPLSKRSVTHHNVVVINDENAGSKIGKSFRKTPFNHKSGSGKQVTMTLEEGPFRVPIMEHL